MTIQRLLEEASKQLTAVTAVPALEAALLLAHTLNKPRSYLLAWPEQAITAEASQRFQSLLARRISNEPLAYITGRREFWSLEFSVNQATLIPRPETEQLVEWVLAHCPSHQEMIRIADLGTGCGAIGIALAHTCPAWQIDATDISETALGIAEKNAQQWSLNNISFHHGDWCAALPQAMQYDVLVSNPPYIAESEWPMYEAGLSHEPQTALVSGRDGLAAIRRILCQAPPYLKPGAFVLLEHGYWQAQAVQALFASSGYKLIDSVRDLAGHERITIGQYVI